MIRTFAVAIFLSCFTISASAQTQPGPSPQTGPVAARPVKKAAPKSKTASKPAASTESGPCQIGVISAIGDKFAVQKVGIMVFGNELTEVPIDGWGLDDLVVARVRAAASGMAVRKIAYAKGSFGPYYHPPAKLFRNMDEDLTAVVRQVAASSSCARYFVFTTYDGKLDGTNQYLAGIGVLNHGTSLFSRTSLFANISLKVFDGQSFAIGRNPHANLGAILAGSLERMTQDPLTKLENEDFPATPGDAPGSATLREHTRVLLTARLDKSLPAFLKQE
jgi:hypothetical protein